MASRFAWLGGAERPFVIAVEPAGAAPALASARVGLPTMLDREPETALAGLWTGAVSLAAWPALQDLVDAFVAILDERALEAMRRLGRGRGADPEVVAGPSGAAGLGGLLAILEDDDLEPVRAAAGLGPEARVLVIVTEGDTDPALRRRVLEASS